MIQTGGGTSSWALACGVVHAHDVVIIGAGPGGSAAAHFLGARGLDVLLLDRANFPRDKTCGDGLTPRALRALERMGLGSIPGCHVNGYEVIAPNGRSTTATVAGARVVPRLTLDHLLLQQAIDRGARFEPGVTVSSVEPVNHGVRVHTQNSGAFDARIGIIATGAATSVLKRSGILRRQPRAMLAARAYFDVAYDLPSTFQLSFLRAPMPGYGWIFPVEKRTANVGVGFLPHKHSGTSVAAMDHFTSGLTGLKQVGPLKGYPIRVDFLRAPTFAPNTLLVGEAAGLVNPLTGEGIDYALESGEIAAEHVVRGLSSGAHHAWHTDYDRLLRSRFEKIFQFSEWIRDWYCKPPLLNLLVPLANRRPELRQLLADIVLGERQPRGYGPATMAARLLIYVARHPG